MSRRALMAEAMAAAPSEAWEPDYLGRARGLRKVGCVAMMMRPTLERRARRGQPAVWAVEAIEWRSGDYNPEGPLRVAHSRGGDLAAALDEAAAELAAKCAGGRP